jgi:hypothetical protein
MDIDDNTYNEIMEDARKRHREYEISKLGKAVNQTINEKDYWEYWLLTSAYKAGVDSVKKSDPFSPENIHNELELCRKYYKPFAFIKNTCLECGIELQNTMSYSCPNSKCPVTVRCS